MVYAHCATQVLSKIMKMASGLGSNLGLNPCFLMDPEMRAILGEVLTSKR